MKTQDKSRCHQPTSASLGLGPSESANWWLGSCELLGHAAHGRSEALARERCRGLGVSLWPLSPLEPPGVVQGCLLLGLEVVSGGH